MLLSWLNAVLCTIRLPIPFPVRAQVLGFDHGHGHTERQPSNISLSHSYLPLSLFPSLSMSSGEGFTSKKALDKNCFSFTIFTQGKNSKLACFSSFTVNSVFLLVYFPIFIIVLLADFAVNESTITGLINGLMTMF